MGIFETEGCRNVRLTGQQISFGECARQFVAFCVDGTKHPMVRFDELKKNYGYASVLERETVVRKKEALR